MQIRFCSCGHKIMVHYFSDKGKWNPILVSDDKKKSHGYVGCCPNCGSPLNINSLL